MSSILEALKKLETESVEEEPGRTTSGGADAGQPPPAPAAGPRGSGRSVLYFALGFLAAACVILLVFIQPVRRTPEKSVPAPRAPAPMKETPPPAGHAPSGEMDPPGPSATAAGPPDQPAVPSPTALRKETLPERPAAPRKETPPAAVAPLSKPSAGPDRSSRAAPGSAVEAPAAESVLKLQAIAWSEDPGRRIAVINGRIVHEGQSMDGKTVDRIGKDTVVLRAGEKAWTLEFKREEAAEPE